MRLALLCVLALGCLADEDEELLRPPQPGSPLMQQYNQGMLLVGRMQAESAIPILKSVIEEDPTFYRAYGKLAEAYAVLGRIPEGEQYFRDLLAHDASNGNAEYGLAQLRLWAHDSKGYYIHLERCAVRSASALPCYRELPNAYYTYTTHPLTAEKTATLLRGAATQSRRLAVASAALLDRNAAIAEREATEVLAGSADTSVEMAFLYVLTDVKEIRSQQPATVPLFRRILPIVKTEGLLEEDVELAGSLASVYVAAGERERGLRFAEYAQRQARELVALPLIFKTLLKFGQARENAGELEAAVQAYGEAMDAARLYPLTDGAALSLYRARLFVQLGRNQDAIRAYQDAIELEAKLHAHADAQAFRGIGNVYWRSGDYFRSLDFQRRAIDAFEGYGDHRAAGATWGNVAGIYAELGDYDSALRALVRARASAVRYADLGEQERLLGDLGDLYLRRGEPGKALTTLQQALAMSRSHEHVVFRAVELTGIGEAEAMLGQHARAVRNFDEAAELAKARGDLANEAASLADAGSSLVKLGRPSEAEDRLRRALSLAEESGLAETAVAASRALSGLERSRGNLKTAFEQLRAAVDRLEAMRATVPTTELRASFLRDRVEIFEDIIGVLAELHSREPSAGYDREAFAYSERARARVFLDLLRGGSAGESGRSEPTPADARAAAELSHGRGVLEFALGRRRSVAWFISDGRVRMALLPRRRVIEEAVEAWRKLAGSGRSSDLDALRVRSQKLAVMLLGPWDERISSGLDLTIIADGALNYLPFEALVLPNGNYVLEEHTVSYAPSVGALAALSERQVVAARRRGQDRLELLAYGDPAFGASSERLPALVRSAYRSAGLDFAPLPNTRREVKAIASFFPERMRVVRVGSAATESSLKAEDLRRYRALHFATHALLDERAPARSGIILAQPDEKGEDGVLRLDEIGQMKFDADIVVLSACQTGLGALMRGEGVIGLARAFQSAGARRVVMSLWKVDDASTADLMESFYTALQRGVEPARALRDAKLGMLNSAPRTYHHPYYWAPFVLSGAN